MSRSHAPFAVLNRVGNPLVRALLRSPLHGLFRGLMLISVTGRRSGRVLTFPVMYRREGDRVDVVVGLPERKRWWRNLRGEGATVRLRIRGTEYVGHAIAEGDERTGVTVHIRLEDR